MLKKLIFFYLAVILTFFSISFANEGNFKNYSEINKCIPFSNDLGEYALNIENCFKKYNQKFILNGIGGIEGDTILIFHEKDLFRYRIS